MSDDKPLIYILESGIGKLRCCMFREHITKLQGIIAEKFHCNVTHIVVDEKIDCNKLCKILKIKSHEMLKNIKVISTKWLSDSIDSGMFVDTTSYPLIYNHKEFKINDISASSTILPESLPSQLKEQHVEKIKYNEFKSHKLKKDAEVYDDKSSYDDSNNEEDLVNDEQNSFLISSQLPKLPLKRKWMCQQSSKSLSISPNKHITDKLEELMEAYKNVNDKWRVLSYQKAIASLKKHPMEITSYEEAKCISGVGDRLADKIAEIIESGGLRKLDEIMSLDQTQALKLFANVWGAGPHAARNWVMAGFRNLDDLKSKAHLTKHQKIGILLYDDLIERMNRKEVELITDMVSKYALMLQMGLIIETCGSYRRGKEDCGDVDILITHPDGKSHVGLFLKLLDKLHSIEFLTHDLVISSEGSQQKYLGVCKLPGQYSKHRRLDIIVVPYNEYPAALVYFTGSGLFNRSMRHLASQLNMSLNEHGLYAQVTRIDKEKMDKGRLLITPTEESIFTILSVPYRPPNERDF